MRVLTNNKQNDVLLMITANAIIAYDAVQSKPYCDYLDSVKHIMDNLSNAALIVGGKKGKEAAMKMFYRRTKIDIKTIIDSKNYKL